MGHVHLCAFDVCVCICGCARRFLCILNPHNDGDGEDFSPEPSLTRRHVTMAHMLGSNYGPTINKLCCIIQYLNATTSCDGDDVYIAYKKVSDVTPLGDILAKRAAAFATVFVGSEVIENDVTALQVDFANMYIGGGVLDDGRVQEELRFTICPELIA